ncbi:hypothetical protein GGR55DRAFT_679365 [Xylaria sp. FL0064]|nr:hypothetical protein GGR55DRAFT_679365 [Xylaria sp. FL0064]
MSSSSHPSASHHHNASISSAGRSSRKGKVAPEPREFNSPNEPVRYFEPTAATDQMLLYGQGNSVVVANHDTLSIERRFSRHSAEVQLLAVDTQSATMGNGRFVVSYDVDMTAIVWDLMTGEEVARFSSYENLTCAVWMRNGNVAFGNVQGNVILFEPMTSEHISARTIDQIPITALAPAADCRTFAIGYQNGSLIIATLQPRFTILHSLSTSRAPSPIVTLAWHASSSRQKSDMLAVQTDDGDLRVWSVAKSFNSNDPAKVVRILKRNDSYQNGPNWMGWSKNGRIIQFSDNETLSWDVRTKHVTWDSIPTLEHVRGLAVYGPGAILFTLGANNTVQQFDLNTPAMMIANVQHPANLLPPSPPVSIEEQPEQGVLIIGTESDSSIPVDTGISESDDDHMSPLARMVRGTDSASDSFEQDRYMSAGSVSTASSTVSKSSANSGTQGRYQPSVQSRGMTENTYISAGSSLRSSTRPPYGDKDAYSLSGVSSVSITSSSRSRTRPSRLRNEVLPSPDESRAQDLFKFTRSRLHDVPYKRTPLVDQTHLTNDDLRRQMLSIIFGWNGEMEDLVRDEMLRHPNRSASRILLAKWLGDIEAGVMPATSENMTSSDWMLLALSGIGGQASQQSLGRAYVQRLLENGDVHAAATIMIGMGDHNDAIEIYISHKKFLEALVLLCLFFPAVWERQAAVIKKWGDFAVQHGQQGLAIRCYACTGVESSEPWTSPSAGQVTFPNISQSIPEVLSPPLSPPGLNRGPQRSIAKSSALKLITSFDDKKQKSKFFADGDDGKTPIAAGVTPIAESAISPGGRDPSTAFLRPSQRSAFNTPASANPVTPGGFGRQRLSSIGEVAADGLSRNAAKDIVIEVPSITQTQPQEHVRQTSNDQYNTGISLARASTASPMMMKDRQSRKEAPPPSPSPESINALMQQGRSSRNGARDRRPEGMELKLNSLDAAMASDVTSPEQSVASSTRFHWPTRRRGPGSVAGSVTSTSSAGRSYRVNHSGTGNRSLTDYIHSLETAQHYSKKQHSRESSRHRQDDRSGRSRENSRSRRAAARESSEERGRVAARNWTPKPAKRSPTSPIPMSPEELINLSTPKQLDIQLNDEIVLPLNLDSTAPSTVRKSSQIRRLSPQRTRVSSRTSSRGGRQKSRERRPPALDIRGRSENRGEGSLMRSPSSPLPMSNQMKFYHESDDEADYRAAVEAQEQFRNRHNRSVNQDPSSPAVSRARERSESRRRRNKTPAEQEPPMPVQQVQQAQPSPPIQPVQAAQPSRDVLTTQASVGDLKQISLERQLKKEAAARELEERRKSLARRPSVPPIMHPDQLSPIVARSPSAFELPQTTFVPPREVPQRSQTADYTTRKNSSMRSPNGQMIGLPATPKAMRLQFSNDTRNRPGVPPIPANYKTSPPSSAQPSPERLGKDSPTKIPEDAPLTLLPSTVYSPPVRPNIPRCMSAPIPEEPAGHTAAGMPNHPAFQHAGNKPARRPSNARKMSVDAGMRGIDEIIGGGRHSRKSSRDDIPPPPPPPPILKELQHLAMPPPPPPAPLPGLRPTVYGSPVGTGSIEIVMDDEEQNPAVPAAAPMHESIVPIIAPPAPPSSRNGHNRGRSVTDNIAGRFTRATERMRSASRGRSNSILGSRTKSPEQTSPYESVPPPPPPVGYTSPPPPPPMPQPSQLQSVERHPREVRMAYQQQQEVGSGLHQSEMI